MILGIGCDIINAERLEKDADFVEHFISRSFSEKEKEVYRKRKFADQTKRLMYVAKRFAAKEAVAKAFGTGFRDGLYLSDIEIFNDELGRPMVHLSAKATLLARQIAGDKKVSVLLSLSDDYPYAEAMAVMEAA